MELNFKFIIFCEYSSMMVLGYRQNWINTFISFLCSVILLFMYMYVIFMFVISNYCMFE